MDIIRYDTMDIVPPYKGVSKDDYKDLLAICTKLCIKRGHAVTLRTWMDILRKNEHQDVIDEMYRDGYHYYTNNRKYL